MHNLIWTFVKKTEDKGHFSHKIALCESWDGGVVTEIKIKRV